MRWKWRWSSCVNLSRIAILCFKCSVSEKYAFEARANAYYYKDNELCFGGFCRQLKCLWGVVYIHWFLNGINMSCLSYLAMGVPCCLTWSFLIEINSLPLHRAGSLPPRYCQGQRWCRPHKSSPPPAFQHY